MNPINGAQTKMHDKKIGKPAQVCDEHVRIEDQDYA